MVETVDWVCVLINTQQNYDRDIDKQNYGDKGVANKIMLYLE